VWARAVGKVAVDVADLLTDPAGPASATPITGRRRASSRASGARSQSTARPRTPHGDGCRTCGAATQPERRTCSDDCAKAARTENEAAFVAAGARSLVALRQIGFQPTLDPAARRRIGTHAGESLAAARDWQRSNPWPADLSAFEREILPGLAGVPLAVLTAATGMSVGYCRRVKAGGVRPHPMWWEAMRAASGKPHVSGEA